MKLSDKVKQLESSIREKDALIASLNDELQEAITQRIQFRTMLKLVGARTK